jgi:hypothetical protein
VSAASESIGIVSSLFVAGSVPQQWRLAWAWDGERLTIEWGPAAFAESPWDINRRVRDRGTGTGTGEELELEPEPEPEPVSLSGAQRTSSMSDRKFQRRRNNVIR